MLAQKMVGSSGKQLVVLEVNESRSLAKRHKFERYSLCATATQSELCKQFKTIYIPKKYHTHISF